MINFKPFSCPYCNKNVANIWEIIVLFSPLWDRRECRHCSKDIIVNHNTLKWILISLVFCFILANLLKNFFSIASLVYDIISIFVFLLLPFFLGKKLFKKHNGAESNGSI